MSYAAPRFLTLLATLSVLAAAQLSAQRDMVKRELPELSSPFANDRAEAVARLVAVEEDISADLRLTYQIADLQERLGLLEIARLREDAGLLQQGVEGLGHDDERMRLEAREYLLVLPFEELQPELADLTEHQVGAWDQFYSFRIRRDISLVLLEAHLMPGKYFGQFDQLRKLDNRRLDLELLKILDADPDFTEPLNAASYQIIDRDTPAVRAFEPSWRRLQAAAGALGPAVAYQNKLVLDQRVSTEVARFPRSAFHAALEVLVSVRAAAARALAGSEPSPELATLLMLRYAVLREQTPTPELLSMVDLEVIRTEIELTLARLGDDTLLQARIERLRSQIDRVQEVRSNVNMRAGSRPDLIAQNEIAHLLLRAGDLEGAEQEWAMAVANTQELMREAEGRNRSSLASYLAAVYYNLACAQSLQSKVSKALSSLKEAVTHGYKDYAWMLDDGDLHNVRVTEGFRAWFMDYAPPAVADRLGDSR